MDYIYYRSLLLTYTFFELFQNVQYKHVSVARAMAYAFHRNATTFFTRQKIKPQRNWKKQRTKLYSLLINSEYVHHIPYQIKSNQQKKIIYSAFAIEGLNVNPEESLVVVRNKAEFSRIKGMKISYLNPEKLVKLNTKKYLQVMKHVKQITLKQGIPKYFKTKHFIQWFAKNLQPVMKIIDGTEKIFLHYAIKGVVQHSSVHPLGYVLVHMAKQRRIPTINLQYGLNDDYQLFSTYVDYYVAWGETHKRRLTRYGVPKHKIQLIGNARFDSIFTIKWKCKKELANILGVSTEKFIFFYPDQAISVQKNKKAMQVILKALLPYKDQVILLVKNHPRQKISSLPPNYKNKYPFVRVVNEKNLHLYDVLNSVDGVFVQFSTVGIEALLFNTPIIILSLFSYTPKHEYSYYSASKYLISANNQEQLNKIIKKFMGNFAYRNEILNKEKVYIRAAYNGKLSSQRIKKFIQEKTK